MGDIARYNDGAVQGYAGCHGILREYLAHLAHRLVEVDTYGVAFAGLPQGFRDKASGIVVHLFNPYTVLVDFTLDVAVGRAADAESHRAGGTVTRQADDTHVVGEVFAAELGAEPNAVSFLEDALFEFHIAEGASRLVARGGQAVVVVGRSELHGEQVALGRSAADDEGDVVRRAGGRTERLHFLNHEGDERVGVEQSLGFLIEIRLVGRAAAFGDA